MINNFSSEEEILKCINTESRKAEYWAEKKLGGLKGADALADKMKFEQLDDHRVKVLPPVSYIAPSGNEWCTVVVVHELYRSRWTEKDWNTFMIYESDYGLGVMMGGFDKGNTAVCFCPPFFGELFGERDIIEDRHLLISKWTEFIKENPRYSTKIIEEDGKRYPYLVFNKYIATGTYVSDEYWRIHTIKSYEQWQSEGADFDEVIQWQKKSHKDYLTLRSELDTIESYHDEKALPMTKWRIESTNYEQFKARLIKDGYIEEDKAYAASVVLFIFDAILKMTGINIADKFYKHPDAEWLTQVKEFAELYEDDISVIEHFFAKAMFEIMNRYGAEREMHEVKKFLSTYERYLSYIESKKFEHSINPRDNMDKKLQEQLRSTLKQFGLRDKFENLVKATRTTYQAYLDWAQPIYAITRMRPYIENEKDRAKFKEADMYWLVYIVNNDRCSQLDGYVKKYGKRGVIQAIRYLVENDIWSSPLGIEGLRKPTPEQFKGLEAIEEAVQYLKGEGIFAGEEEKLIEFDEPEEETSGTMAEAKTATGVQTKAQTACKRLRDHFEQMQIQVAAIEKYIGEDDLVDMLEEENKQLTKDNEDLRESIKTVNRQLSQAQKDFKKQEGDAYNARKERDEKKKSYDEIMAKYVQLKKEHDELKQMAKEADAVPKAKIIPLSKLEEIPLVGKAVLHGLIPFLKKYNIVVDEKK